MRPALEQSFHDAPFAADGWRRAMSALAEATHSRFVNIGEYSLSTATMRPYLSNFVDRGLLRDVDTIQGYAAAVNWRLTAVTAPFVMVREDELNAARRARTYAGSLYNDLVQTHDLPNGCQTVLAVDGDAMLALWTHRGHAEGATSADELDLFQTVAPSVLKSIRLQQAIGSQGAELLSGSLDTMKAAAFVLGGAGQVLAMTPGASRLAAMHAVVAVAGTHLRATDRASNDRLQAAIATELRAGPEAVARRLWLRQPAELHTGLVAELFSLPVREWNFGFAPRVIVVLRPPGGIDAAATLLLQQSFDLSRAEADVAVAIARGQTRAEIALGRGVSVDTVHAQLKSIYRKTDVRREAELVALVVRLAA